MALAGCGEPAEQDRSASDYANLSESVSYVGSETCASCHADKFETFSESQMGRSFKDAQLSHSAAEWEDVEPVYDDALDLYYQAFHRGQNLFIMEFRLADGDTVHKRVEQIDYIVGSGQHTNSHIMSVNGYLYQMPMTWYAQDGKWDLPPKFDGGNNYRFSRPITEACMTCHNAIPGFVEGSENRFSNVPHGIDCERCHGPGEIHVDEKRAGKIVNTATEIDYSIVNPGKLPLDRQFDVCQRCHMQGATVFADGKDPDDFRPGMKLTDVLNVFWPRYADSTSRFIMASHPDRLKMSECFVGSHESESSFEGMTCITCHDPHLPIETLGADHYQSVCQSCHEPAHDENIARAHASRGDAPVTEVRLTQSAAGAGVPSTAPSQAAANSRAAGTAGECTAPIEAREARNDNCVACHMPISGSDDIPHVRVTDHYIRVVEGAVTGAIGENAERTGVEAENVAVEEGPSSDFVGLASLVAARPSEREMADGYMAYYEEISDVPYFLDSAAVHLERALDDASVDELAPSLVRLHYLKRDYDELVRLSRQLDAAEITDAWTLYRIGESFENTGNAQESLRYFRMAAERAPYHLRFVNRLGMAYVSSQRFGDALDTFDRVLSENPKYEDAYNNRGFARAMQGDLQGAEQDLKRAIELNPNAEQAIANLASLYLNTNRQEDARPYAARLLELAPNNENYQRLWQLLQ